MALHCAVALALSFWFVRVFMCVRWVLCVCAPLVGFACCWACLDCLRSISSGTEWECLKFEYQQAAECAQRVTHREGVTPAE